MKKIFGNNSVLKLAILVTGISGIVAEYALATLASYFLGNQLVQWTLVISIMLFAMGLGSRLSRYIQGNLLERFILLEIILSFFVGFSALIVYSVAAFSYYEGFLIYFLAILIGLLIGLEIPLVTRINQEYEKLKTNISSILEKDYYGSLIGGVFFAFIGLPYLGFTYTPIFLAVLNLLVAAFLFFKLKKDIRRSWVKKLGISMTFVFLALVSIAIYGKQITLWGDQMRYKDKVIFSEQTKYQHITITQWEEHIWLYINNNQQLSSLDEFMYHEPMVHPVMALNRPKEILIIGGGDGCALREILKHDFVEKVTIVDLDPAMTRIAKENPLFTTLNDSALWSDKLEIIHGDGKSYLEQSPDYFDAILIDLPDPKTVDLGMLYSREFYQLANKRLRPNGVIITQSGSPYYATKAFYCIEKTMNKAGFKTLPIQNQILTLGQWGWIIGLKSQSPKEAKERLLEQPFFPELKTKWLTKSSLHHILYFGKPMSDTSGIEVNTLNNPILYQYYNKGNWDLY